MHTGKVKWFNNAKGYGFILPEQGGEDLFAHYSTIQMDGYKTLRAGQCVQFDIVAGPKGMHAVNICALADTAGAAIQADAPDYVNGNGLTANGSATAAENQRFSNGSATLDATAANAGTAGADQHALA